MERADLAKCGVRMAIEVALGEGVRARGVDEGAVALRKYVAVELESARGRGGTAA